MTLEQIMEAHPQKKESIMTTLTQYLTSFFSKPLAVSSLTLIHTILLQYFNHASPSQIQTLSALLRDHLVAILHTRDGSLVVRKVILKSTAKDRKAILKTFKGLVVKVAKEQYGHHVLMTILDAVDDTTLISKVILPELLKSNEDALGVSRDKYGSKVLLYILCGRRSRYIPASLVTEFLQEDELKKDTSKKDADTRALENQVNSIEFLMSLCLEKCEEMIRCKEASTILMETIKLVGTSENVKLKSSALVFLLSCDPLFFSFPSSDLSEELI